jgi:hypothetical protein
MVNFIFTSTKFREESDSDDVLTSSENRHPRKRRKIVKKTVVTATNPLLMPTTATIPGTSIADPSMEDVIIAGSSRNMEREDLQ